MTEEMITKRMEQIMNEYSALPQFDRYDLQLVDLDSSGDIEVTITKTTPPRNHMKRIIRAKESLSFIGDTFGYPNTYSVRSKDIATESVKRAYFDIYGDLIVEHEDSVEKFKVKPINKADVIQFLTLRLGNKFIREVRASDPNSPIVDN